MSKIFSRYPLDRRDCNNNKSGISGNSSSPSSSTKTSSNNDAATPGGDDIIVSSSTSRRPPKAVELSEDDVFGYGTDFSANETTAGNDVRLSVPRPTTLDFRRIFLEDVRVLKTDVLVFSFPAHVSTTFDAVQQSNNILRNNFESPRVWVLLTLDDDDMSSQQPGVLDVNASINAIFPSYLRPRRN